MAELRLGGIVDPATHQRTGAPVTLPSEELTTHGVIVGMTGSGKTGLGVVLIEECLRAGIPALLIDPKGDLTNLALTFPGLSAAEFQPWVNPGDAAKAGQSVEDFAAAEAQRWAQGLAGWELGPPDVAALHSGVDVAVYTPGAPHGIQLNVIGSLDAPADLGDPQAVAEEIDAYVSSLLNLLGIESDPMSSREHILLATIINASWAQGRALDMATLVASVQQPPMRKVGVLDLDAYYPPADRMKLAMRLNGLLAAPAFAPWMEGQRIDIDAMLHGPDGRPRCAIVSITHLSDEQRQSATSVVLTKLISWMRRQSGTSDLRTLVYMDEVAGYLPPNGNPPTKEPLMLLLKQARAFGVGVVLSTQNPVDVDYKALSNAGTWLIGRLQTEQDKNRLLDGLTSAAGTIDQAAVAATISAMGKREFVLKRASKDSVEVMTTRWAMSYLRGPLSREQVASLTAGRAGGQGVAAGGAQIPGAAQAPRSGQAAPAETVPGSTQPAPTQPAPTQPTPAQPAPAQPAPTQPTPAQPAPAATSPTPGSTPPTTPLAADESPVAPAVAAGVPVSYLDPAASWAAQVGAVPGHRLVPAAIARVLVRFDDTKADLILDQEYEAVLSALSALPDARAFVAVDYDDRDLLPTAPPGAVYRLPPSEVARKPWWTTLQRDLTDHLVRSLTVEIPTNPTLKLYGRVGESAEQFAARCQAAAADGGDQAIAALRSKYERRLGDIQRRVTTAQGAVDRQRSQRNSSMASDMLGGLFGRRSMSIGTSMRRMSTANSRVDAAESRVDDLERQLADVQADLDAETRAIADQWRAKAADLSTMAVGLERTDVRVTQLGLVWIPVGT